MDGCTWEATAHLAYPNSNPIVLDPPRPYYVTLLTSANPNAMLLTESVDGDKYQKSSMFREPC